MDVAKITILGRMVADPEFRSLDNGKIEMRCTVAANSGREKEDSAFYSISMRMDQERYGKLYYIFEHGKGKKVLVMGDLKPRRAQNSKDYAYLNVNFADIQMLDPVDKPQTQPEQPAAPETYMAPPSPQPPQSYQPQIPQPPAFQTPVPPALQQPPVPQMRPPAKPAAGNAFPPPPPFVG